MHRVYLTHYVSAPVFHSQTRERFNLAVEFLGSLATAQRTSAISSEYPGSTSDSPSILPCRAAGLPSTESREASEAKACKGMTGSHGVAPVNPAFGVLASQGIGVRHPSRPCRRARN